MPSILRRYSRTLRIILGLVWRRRLYRVLLQYHSIVDSDVFVNINRTYFIFAVHGCIEADEGFSLTIPQNTFDQIWLYVVILRCWRTVILSWELFGNPVYIKPNILVYWLASAQSLPPILIFELLLLLLITNGIFLFFKISNYVVKISSGIRRTVSKLDIYIRFYEIYKKFVESRTLSTRMYTYYHRKRISYYY